MKGKQYLDLLEKWEIIETSPKDSRINPLEQNEIEYFLKEWSSLHMNSLKNDNIWGDSAELPMIPTTGTLELNKDLITNISLYAEKQIIYDPIDLALAHTGSSPMQHYPRFTEFFKRYLHNLIELYPLIKENLIDMMPYHLINSQFNQISKKQLEKDWFENESLKYIEERTISRVYHESNLLAIRFGDLDGIRVEKYGYLEHDTIKETENGIIVKGVFPPTLEGIEKEDITNWVHSMFHKNTTIVARNINESILLAELFSGSNATCETLTYNFMKMKNSSITQENPNLSTHYIPIMGEVNLERFVDFRSNEMPSFTSFREEWTEGRGLFKGDISSKDWLGKLNQELNKCEMELKNIKKDLRSTLLGASAWSGLGITVGVFTGGLLVPVILTGMVPLARDIKNDWNKYLQTKQKIESSSPFFLLNVIDQNTHEIKTDIPKDLPTNLTMSNEVLQGSLETMKGAPIIDPYYPQK